MARTIVRRYVPLCVIWELKDKPTRKTISMAELRKIIVSERKAQYDCNGMCDESRQAIEALELVWRIANKYEDQQ